mgnify:CR=1 FL=1
MPMINLAALAIKLLLPISAKDVLRAAVFKNMLIQVFKNLEEDEHDDV